MRPLPRRALLALSFLLSFFSTALPGQSGRTLTVDQPLQLGKTSVAELSYPAAAAGHVGWFVLAAQLSGTTTVTVPGWTMVGDVRIDPTQIWFWEPWVAGSGAGTAT
ncbi:MAG: hypothetical protein KDB53_19740, partial [Planctomycetes bacterium]|nr:hypothetical protein [Planctomycetota bacterium]